MPFGWVIAGAAVVGAGTAIAGTVNQANAASSQLGIEQQQLQMAQTTFGEQQQFEQQLAALINNPSSVSQLPGFQFQLQTGSDAVARQMAAGGFLNSGNEAAALTQYGQGLAQSFYGQQAQLLGQLSGVTAAASPAQYGSAGAYAGANAGQQWQNLAGQMGMFAGRYGPWGSAGGAGAPIGATADTPGYGGLFGNTTIDPATAPVLDYTGP